MSGNETVKSLIRELLAKGYTLSQVQTELKAQGHPMTFMELRLLAAELQDIQWSAPEPPPAPDEIGEKGFQNENYRICKED